MGKGQGKSGSKTSHYQFKKRCCNCDKRAKHQNWDGKYYCKDCWRELK